MQDTSGYQHTAVGVRATAQCASRAVASHSASTSRVASCSVLTRSITPRVRRVTMKTTISLPNVPTYLLAAIMLFLLPTKMLSTENSHHWDYNQNCCCLTNTFTLTTFILIIHNYYSYYFLAKLFILISHVCNYKVR
jgi:hypothetical protein